MPTYINMYVSKIMYMPKQHPPQDPVKLLTIRGAVITSEMALAVYLILTVALHVATSCCTCESGTSGESVTTQS